MIKSNDNEEITIHLEKWFIVKLDDATTHVLSHCFIMAIAVFEGIRAYETAEGPAIFKAKEHYDRLMASAKLIYMTPTYTTPELIEATQQLISKNKLKSCYIRPLFYFGYGGNGFKPWQKPG